MAKKSKSRSSSSSRSYRTARRILHHVANPRLSVLTPSIFRLPGLHELLTPPVPTFRRAPAVGRVFANRNVRVATTHPIFAPDVDVRAIRVCQSRAERREVLFSMRRTGRGSARGPRRPKSEVKC